MNEKILREEMKKVEASYAKVEGFMEAAIGEMHPSHSAYGVIEGMLVYQTPTIKGVDRDVRLIRNQLHDTRRVLRDLMDSLRDAKNEMIGIYELEIKNGKDTN